MTQLLMPGPARLLLVLSAVLAAPAVRAQLVDVKMIWGRAETNTFTDLIRFRERWYCVFREGSSRTSPDGSIRVLSSPAGNVWQSAGVLAIPDADLQDPKLSVTPTGQLLLTATANQEGQTGRTLIWSSRNGRDWDDPVRIGEPGVRLWRFAWHLGRAYSIGFSTSGPGPVRLYSGADGVRFQVHAGPLFPAREDGQCALLFLPDGDSLCLLRGDGVRQPAQLGKSRPPYKAWTWTDLEQGIAGPAVVRLPDGRIAVAALILDDTVRLALCWLDPELGNLSEFLKLPSGGEMGGPGLAYHDGQFWVSYHSSQEGRAMIYLARVNPPPRGEPKANRKAFAAIPPSSSAVKPN